MLSCLGDPCHYEISASFLAKPQDLVVKSRQRTERGVPMQQRVRIAVEKRTTSLSFSEYKFVGLQLLCRVCV